MRVTISTMATVSQTIRVEVLFFGSLKELVGRNHESTELPNRTDIASLFQQYVARFPQLLQYRSSLVASCNREFAPWSTTLHDGDEVAFLPPVSGG
jgi:molybdopterin converting factor subunit 1